MIHFEAQKEKKNSKIVSKYRNDFSLSANKELVQSNCITKNTIEKKFLCGQLCLFFSNIIIYNIFEIILEKTRIAERARKREKETQPSRFYFHLTVLFI
jgi:hypothetical protein